jgi:hypothetical protein
MSPLKNPSDKWFGWEALMYSYVLEFKVQLLYKGYVSTTAL